VEPLYVLATYDSHKTGKKPPVRTRSKWEDNITIDVQEMGLG